MTFEKIRPTILIRAFIVLILVLPLLFACDDQNEADLALDDSPSVGFVKIGKFDLSNLSTSQTNTIFVTAQDVDIEVKASDDIAVKEVILFIGGTEVGRISKSPYNFNVGFPSAGEVTLKAEAVDNDGNKGEVTQKVTVDNQKPSLNVNLLVNSTSVDVSQPPLPAVDTDDEVAIIATPNDESSGVNDTTVELTVEGQVVADPSNLGRQVYQLDNIVDFNNVSVIDVSLKAIDAAGNESDPVNFSFTVKDRTDGPDLELPTVSIDIANIEPGAIDSSSCSLPACYEGTISVPMRVEDETGTAEVTLIVESEALGKSPVAKMNSFPYVVVLNTLDYPNNDKLTLVAQVTSEAGEGDDSTPVTIEVFNEAPPPVLSINSPASGDQISGILPVSVTIGQLTSSEYTLDLNGDGLVDASIAGAEQEGIHLELIDFTGEIIDEQRLSDATTNSNITPTRGGSYETREGFDTNELANDTYTLRVTVKARLRNAPNGQIDVELIRTIQIDTDNSSRVPPSLLILSPTNPVGVVRTIRDPDNAYVSVQATDNTGLAFIELRVFTGKEDDDTTPSRFIYASSGEVFTTVALPINYNADPYILDGSHYTVRIVAQDVDGNRTFQDITINLERSVDAGYQLRQIGPITNTGVAEPCLQLVSPVPKDNSFTLVTALDFDLLTDTCKGAGQTNISPIPQVSKPVEAGDTFDHLLKLPTEAILRPLSNATGTTSSGYSIGFSDKGSYSFITQVITASGDIYTTNSEVVSVID